MRHGHHLVKGWLYPGAPEAIVLLSEAQKKAQISGGVAEIGVHHGKLFILLYLLRADGERAVAIDIFSQQELNVDRSGAGNLERFKRNLERHADLKYLIVREGDSTALTAKNLLELGKGAFRLISIDGGHTADITAHDLATSEGALMKGGIVILDDCFKQMWPGVISGVGRYFSEPRTIVPFGIGANKTFFCHPEYVSMYSEALRFFDKSAIQKEFLGCPVVCFEFAPWTLGRWFRRVDAFRAVRRLYHDLLSRLCR